MDKRLIAWYNEHIVAEWYKSAALIGGWLTSLVIFLPDILQFVADHFDAIGGFAFPTMTPENKALILGVYVTFIAPPLRAWQQRSMQAAAKKQEVERVIDKLESIETQKKGTTT
jgi:hypothetical protein